MIMALTLGRGGCCARSLTLLTLWLEVPKHGTKMVVLTIKHITYELSAEGGESADITGLWERDLKFVKTCCCNT